MTMGQIHSAFARDEISASQAADLTAKLLARVPWWLRFLDFVFGA